MNRTMIGAKITRTTAIRMSIDGTSILTAASPARRSAFMLRRIRSRLAWSLRTSASGVPSCSA